MQQPLDRSAQPGRLCHTSFRTAGAAVPPMKSEESTLIHHRAHRGFRRASCSHSVRRVPASPFCPARPRKPPGPPDRPEGPLSGGPRACRGTLRACLPAGRLGRCRPGPRPVLSHRSGASGPLDLSCFGAGHHKGCRQAPIESSPCPSPWGFLAEAHMGIPCGSPHGDSLRRPTWGFLAEAHEDHSGIADPAGPIHMQELIPRDRPVAQQELRRGDGPILRSWSFLNNRCGRCPGHRPHTLAWSNRLVVFHMPHITVSSLRATACQALAAWIPFRVNRA